MAKDLANASESNPADTQTFAGAFLMLLPIVPIIATIISIATYLGMNLRAPATLFEIPWLDTLFPLLVGTVSTFMLWVILSVLLHRFTAVDRVNEESYYSLIDHQATLKYYTNTYPDRTAEVKKYLDSFEEALTQPSASWVTGKGYIELWTLMNSAEEALVTAAPVAKVIADATYDEMRLNNSKIENSEEWANKLRTAVNVLDPDAIRYLKPSLGTQTLKSANDKAAQDGNQDTVSETLASNQGENTTRTPQPSASNQGENTISTSQPQVSDQERNLEKTQNLIARSILRDVRETINDFNANCWAALINARLQLFSTMILVGLTMFVFVALAIVLHVNRMHLEVATFYAFIGAVVGLIGRLSLEAQSDKAVDDYRLSHARLLVTPLLSSLTAVIGVLIVAKTTDLNLIYNINANLVPNLIIAATFGLSPNLLINQLQKKSDEYKGNLQSTQPTSGK